MRKKFCNIALVLCLVSLLFNVDISHTTVTKGKLIECCEDVIVTTDIEDSESDDNSTCILPEVNDWLQNESISEENSVPVIAENSEKEIVEQGVDTTNNSEEQIEEFFSIPDGTYNYCPSVIVNDDNVSIFYCSNIEAYQISDNICYSDAVINDDGSVSFKNRSIVLSPTTDSWDSMHVCDPSVISGRFTYQGAAYNYLMAYLGCDTTDNQQNQIGLAVSNCLSSGWVKVGSSPIIEKNYDSSQSAFQWGVGQPSLINLDGSGHVLLFYTEGTYDLTCTKVQEWDFSNLDAPILLSYNNVSNAGTNDFISNADFALSGQTLYMICDTHPFGGNVLDCIPDSSCVYSCFWDGTIESLSSVSWNKVYTVNQDNTGFPKNHNCGIYRTSSGGLSRNGVIYTAANENSDFLSSLCTYRLRHIEW